MSDSTAPSTSAETDPLLQTKTVYLTTATGSHPVRIPPANLAERRYASARVRKAPPSKEYPGHDHPNGINGAPQYLTKQRVPKVEPVDEGAAAVPAAPVAPVVKKKPPRKEPVARKKPVKEPKSKRKKEKPVEVKIEPVEPEPVKQEPAPSPPIKRHKLRGPQPVVLYEPEGYQSPSDAESDVSGTLDLTLPATLPVYVPFEVPVPRHYEVLPCEDYDLADVLSIHECFESLIQPVEEERLKCIMHRKLVFPDVENMPLLPLEDPSPYSCYLQTANLRAQLFVRAHNVDERFDLPRLRKYANEEYTSYKSSAFLYYLQFIDDQKQILSRGSTVTQYLKSFTLARVFAESLNNRVEPAVLDMVDIVLHIGTREVMAHLCVLLRFVNSMARSVVKHFEENCLELTQQMIKEAVSVPIADPYFYLIEKCPFTRASRVPDLVVVMRSAVDRMYNTVNYDVFHNGGFKHLWESMQMYFPRKGYDVREIVLNYKYDEDGVSDAMSTVCRTLRECVRHWASVTVIAYGTQCVIAHRAAVLVDGLNAIIGINPEMAMKDEDTYLRLLEIPLEDYCTAYCPVMYIVGEDHRNRVFKHYFDRIRELVPSGYGLLFIDHANKFMKVRERTLLGLRITQTVVNRLILDHIYQFLITRSLNKDLFLTANEPNENRDLMWTMKPEERKALDANWTC